MSNPFHDPVVEERFSNFKHTETALKMRAFVYTIAENLELHTIQESLKWNQPSYVCEGGTAVRIAEQNGKIGYFVSCQTSIIESLKKDYPECDFDKTRGLLFNAEAEIPEVASKLIRLALQYKTKQN